MVKENKNLSKEIIFKVNIKMGGLMDLGHTNGQMVLFIKVCLKMVFDMERENGLQIKQNILETILKVLKKVTVNCIFQVEIFTKEILLVIADKDMEKCFGLMDHFTKDSGKTESRMEKDKFILLVIKL